MSTYRAALLTLSVVAISLAATGTASLTAWDRCGRGSDCSTDLAIAAVNLAPVAIIGSTVLVLLRSRATGRWLRAGVLSAAVGLATLPLAAFLMRELWSALAFAFLMACLLALVISAEDRAASEASGRGVRAPAAPEQPVPAAEQNEAAGAPAPDELPALVDEVLAVGVGIRELCSRLARTGALVLGSGVRN